MQTFETLSDYKKHISEITIITEMYKKHSDILSTFINKLLELQTDKQKEEGCLFDSKYEEYKFHIHYKIEENNTFTLNINNEIDTFKNNFMFKFWVIINVKVYFLFISAMCICSFSYNKFIYEFIKYIKA